MKEIKQVTTMEELCNGGGAETGNVFVDGFVEWLKANISNSVEDAAVYMGIPYRMLVENIRFFVGVTPSQLTQRWRSIQLLDLLDENQYTLDQIARKLHLASNKEVEAIMRKVHKTTIGAYLNGTARRNGNYVYNHTAEGRRKVEENAEQLRNRNKE